MDKETDNISRTINELFQHVNTLNRETYQQGFVMGARTMVHLINDGQSPDKALEICEGHKFIEVIE